MMEAMLGKSVEIQISDGDTVWHIPAGHVTSFELSNDMDVIDTFAGPMFGASQGRFTISGMFAPGGGQVAEGKPPNQKIEMFPPSNHGDCRHCGSAGGTESLFHPGTCINCGAPFGGG